MPVLTDFASARIRRNAKTLYGKTLSRPALLVSDGLQAIYACEVDIGPTDPTGRINQYKDFLRGLAEQDETTLEDLLTVNTVLHNVVLARNNAELIYADIGSPVKLERTESGQWQITGLSIEQPGTYFMVPVRLSNKTIGTALDLSLVTRRLSLGEMGILAPFGQLPFGSSGIFIGDTLAKVL